MLAVKFYNLQALIHRPLLSPSKLMASCSDPMAFHQAEFHRISMSKRKCVMAAQQTAKLLHNLEDKKSLIYGFPWWQMISCLICASSILLVASICVNLDSESESEVFRDIDWLAVDEDAEVCLQVFQALSSNSNAARLARDMMQRLKKTRTISYGKFPSSPSKHNDAAMTLVGETSGVPAWYRGTSLSWTWISQPVCHAVTILLRLISAILRAIST
jgi:hypothetical protein